MESKSDEEAIRSVPPPDPPAVGAIDCASTVTHTRPSATVSACGLPPTAIVAIGLLVLGLIRVTVPSPLLATHTDPAPNATPAGERPTGIVAVTARVPGSIRTTASSSESATHTPPPPTAIPVGPLPTGDRRRQPGRVDPNHVVGVAVGEPDRAVAERDPGRAGVRDRAARATLPGRGVQARQQARGRRDPDRVALRRDGPRPARDDIADPHAAADESNSGSMRPTDTLRSDTASVRTRPPIRHRRLAAMPVGGPRDRDRRAACADSLGRSRETV